MFQRLVIRIGLVLAAAALVYLAWPVPPSSETSTSPSAGSPRRASAPPVTSATPAPAPSASTAAPATSPLQAFTTWSAAYLAASPTERAALVPIGVELAKDRRETLARLIRGDPRAALDAAVRPVDRAQLPSEVVALLEERISGQAGISLTYRCFGQGGHADHSHLPVRSVVLGGREFEAHVYGPRDLPASIPSASVVGIAIGRDLAVSAKPLRVLDPGESAGGLPLAASALAAGITPATPLNLSGPAVAVEASGSVHLLQNRNEIPAFAESLRQPEKVNLADNQPGTSTVVGRPSQAWTHGPKKILVIRVDFSDLTGVPLNFYEGNSPITESYVVNVMNQAQGVTDFFAASSFGKTSLSIAPAVAGDSPDVTPVLRLPNTAASYATSGDTSLLHSHARQAAVTAGFNTDAYDRVGVVFSNLSNISGSKITFGGLANVVGSEFWVNSAFDFRVVAHELGHTYGLRHANLWQVADSNPVSAAGSSTEYGDPFDVMGEGDFFENDFGPWGKSLLQWIPDSAVTIASTAGTFRVRRFDSPSADLSQPRALKIVRDSARDFWIGYRRGTANASADGGAYVLWGYNTNQVSNLLDLTTPGSTPSDACLAVGRTFADTASGISLTTVAQGGSGSEEWIDVQVAFQPRVSWALKNFLVNEQSGSAVLTLRRDGNSTGAVSVTYATAAGVATSPADFTASSGTVSWADGDSTTTTVTIPVVADALVEGSETFTVTLGTITGGVIVDGNSATVTLADPGSRDTSFNADFTNNTVNRVLPLPDGSILAAGYFSSLQDSSFISYPYRGIARFTSSGLLDKDFNPGTGVGGGSFPVVLALARQPDGKILIGGEFTSFNGATRGNIARLNPSGSLDTSFNPVGTNGRVYHILLMPNGQMILGGDFTSCNGTAREYLARLNPDGSLDTSFTGPDFGDTGGWNVQCLALQNDGKILAGGVFYFPEFNAKASLCRLNANGSLDSTFTGVTGGADPSFGTGGFLGEIKAIAIQPDGKILIGGDFTQFNGVAHAGLARLTSTGTLDSSYAPATNAPVNSIVLQPAGQILIGGEFTTVNGTNASRIARLSPAGVLDSAFTAAGGHASNVSTLAFQPDGNLLLGGYVASFQGSSNARPLWRFLPGLPGLPGSVQLSTDAFSGTEGGSVTLSVNRTGGSAGSLSVGYSTVAGTATSADFTPATGVLTWADGDTASKSITVSLTADAVADGTETFSVNLGQPLASPSLLGARQSATVSVSSAFDSWRAAAFSSLELADPAISGDNADPDGDGLPNLLEYAFGFAPRVAQLSPLPFSGSQTVSGANYLSLTFRRRIGATDLAYTPQTAPSPAGPWSAGAIQLDSSLNNGDGTETVTFRDSSPSTASARFMRVLVTRTP